MLKVFLLLLIPFVTTAAQAPPPCSAAELKRAMAEARAITAETRAEARALRIEMLERENAQQRTLVVSTAQGLAAEQKKTSILTTAQEEAQMKITALKQSLEEQQLQIAQLVAQRDALAKKIANANGRIACEVFHIGCIGRK